MELSQNAIHHRPTMEEVLDILDRPHILASRNYELAFLNLAEKWDGRRVSKPGVQNLKHREPPLLQVSKQPLN